jgi:hypothetical protein
MPITAIDPWFTVIPLIGLVVISLAVSWFQWLPPARDWTLALPTASLVSSLLCLVAFSYQLAATPTTTYVNLSAIPRLLQSQEAAAPSYASPGLMADLGYRQFGPRPAYAFTTRPKAVSPPEIPITAIRDVNKRDDVAWISLVLVAVFVPAMASSTVVRLAPGPFFDTIRGSLRIKQAFALAGAVERGSEQQRPRTVPPYSKEMKAVRQNAEKKSVRRPRTTLEELEIETAKLGNNRLRQLTEDEIAKIKTPLYDRFVDS